MPGGCRQVHPGFGVLRRRRGKPNRPAGGSIADRELGEQFVVGLVLFKRRGKRFHGLDGIQIHHRAAEFANRFEVFGGEQFFLLARAGLGNVDGRKQAAIRQLAVEDQLHVAGALEFLKDQLIHARTGVHQRGGQDGQRAAVFDLAGGGKHLARDFQRAGIHAAGHRAAAAAMHAVVGAGDARERIHEHEDIAAGFHETPAALDHESGQAHMGFEFHVVGGGHDFRLHRALKIGDFLGALVDEQHHRMHFGMVGGDGVADLLKDGGFAGAGRRHDQAARAFADGRDQVDHPGFDEVRGGFQLELLDGIDAGQVFEADGLGVILEGHFIDLVHRLELGAGAAVRRLGGAFDEAAFAQETTANGVRRDEDIRRLGMKMTLGGAQEAKALLGNFEIA